jgi:hypothetical protein
LVATLVVHHVTLALPIDDSGDGPEAAG